MSTENSGAPNKKQVAEYERRMKVLFRLSELFDKLGYKVEVRDGESDIVWLDSRYALILNYGRASALGPVSVSVREIQNI
jgi:hypothetical protein